MTTVPPATVSTVRRRNVSVSTTVGVVGVITTVATGGGATVIVALPTMPSTVAEIVTPPGITPVTNPAALTVAALALLVLHVTLRPVMTPPVASNADAASCDVSDTITVADDGVTLTVATATGSSPPQATIESASAADRQPRRRHVTTRTVRRSVSYEDKMDMGRG